MALTRLPSRLILDGSLTDVDVAAANKDGAVGTACMRTLGTGAQQACAGNDSRLSDDRVASGLRTATTVVSVNSATAPSAGQILVALSDSAAEWQDQVSALTTGDFIAGEIPTGVIDGANAVFTLANTPVAGSVKVFLGARLREGASDDYTIAGATITFNSGAIPESGENLLVDYIKAA